MFNWSELVFLIVVNVIIVELLFLMKTPIELLPFYETCLYTHMYTNNYEYK